MKKNIFSKVVGGVLGTALAAMVIMASTGSTSVTQAAKKSEPASYSFGLSPSVSHKETNKAEKETTVKAHVVPGYFYNTTGGTVYYRLIHAAAGTAATERKKVTSSTDSFTLGYLSTNVKNEYKLQASVENATRGYVATIGSWWP